MPMVENPRVSLSNLVNSSRNNGGEGRTRASLFCAAGTKEGGRGRAYVLWTYHCRLVAPTGSKSLYITAGSSHQPAVIWTFTAGLYRTPIIFALLRA